MDQGTLGELKIWVSITLINLLQRFSPVHLPLALLSPVFSLSPITGKEEHETEMGMDARIAYRRMRNQCHT